MDKQGRQVSWSRHKRRRGGQVDRLASLAALLLAAGPALTGSAFAADAGSVAQTSAAAPAPQAGTLEEVVVTAEKRSSTVQRTPISIATVSGKDLLAKGGATLADSLTNVPAVTIDSGPAGFLVRIRGEGLNLPPTVGDPTVAINYDSIYDSQVLDTFLGFFDVARVEVLRGPQATLYGRNSTGGAVNIISNDPVLDAFGVNGTVGIGNYNAEHFAGTVNVPLTDALAVRIAASADSHDGYLSDGENGLKDKAVRVKILYHPDDALRVLIGAEYGVDTGTPGGAIFGFGTTQPIAPWYDPHLANNTQRDIKVQKYWLNADYRLSFADLTILPAFQRLDVTKWLAYFAEPPFAPLQLNQSSETQVSVEARLASLPGSRITWVGGFYYYDVPRFPSYSESSGPQLDPTSIGYSALKQQLETKAVFGQLTYPLSDKWRLLLGLRESEDTKSIVSVNNSYTIPQLIDDSGSLKSWNFAYKAGIETDITSKSFLTAYVSSGYVEGGFNTNDKSEFGPERLTSFEIDSKNRFFGNRLSLNAGIFDYEIHHDQASDNIVNPYVALYPDAGLPGTLSHVSSASARSIGGELEATWLITPNDRLTASYEYLDAHYLTFQDPTLGAVYNGGVLPTSPTTTFTASLDHTFEFGNGATLTPHIDTRYHTKYYTIFNYKSLPPFFPAGEAEEPANTMSNGSMTYAAASGKWSVTGYVQNIEDHATKSGLFGPFVSIGPPRTFGVTLTARFGQGAL